MHYEILYLLSGSQEEKNVELIKEKLKKLLETLGAKVMRKDSLGLRPLFYRIKKDTQGYYLLFEFDSEKDKIKILKEKLFLMPEILRFLIVQTKIKTVTQLKKEKELKAKIEEKEKRKITKELIKEEPKPEIKKEKVKMEELDKKLEEILSDVNV